MHREASPRRQTATLRAKLSACFAEKYQDKNEDQNARSYLSPIVLEWWNGVEKASVVHGLELQKDRWRGQRTADVHVSWAKCEERSAMRWRVSYYKVEWRVGIWWIIKYLCLKSQSCTGFPTHRINREKLDSTLEATRNVRSFHTMCACDWQIADEWTNHQAVFVNKTI